MSRLSSLPGSGRYLSVGRKTLTAGIHQNSFLNASRQPRQISSYLTFRSHGTDLRLSTSPSSNSKEFTNGKCRLNNYHLIFSKPVPVTTSYWSIFKSSKIVERRNRTDDHYEYTNNFHHSVHILFAAVAAIGLASWYVIYFCKQGLLPVAFCKEQLEHKSSNCMNASNAPSKADEPFSAGNHCTKSMDQEKSSSPRSTGMSSLAAAISKTKELCMRKKEECLAPGLIVSVSVDGKQVYSEGFGYADIENRVPIHSKSALRIASISKMITATIVAKLYENNQIDLEKPVQAYVPKFPEKEWMGEKVEIKVKHLLDHTSGIRHYKVKNDQFSILQKEVNEYLGGIQSLAQKPFFQAGQCRGKSMQDKESNTKKEVEGKKKEDSMSEPEEKLSMKKYNTTAEALTMFEKDRLLAKPGTKFLYTTFGFTLLAAVIEGSTKKSFKNVLSQTLKHLGLQETYLDEHDPLVYNRAKAYEKSKQGKLVNAPYVDCSYKWAGGGILSTADDLIKLGNILLYSYQHEDGHPGLPGYLKTSTVRRFWTPEGPNKERDNPFALGFELLPEKENYGMCQKHDFAALHTGAAIGVSSILHIIPRKLPKDSGPENVCGLVPAKPLPQGVVVTVIVNMAAVSLRDVADKVAKIFQDADFQVLRQSM